MNNLENTKFGFIYSTLEIILYGITTVSGVICENPPTKVAGVNLQKVIGCAIGGVGTLVALFQLFNYNGTFLHVIQLILTWLSIIYLLKIFGDALDRRLLGRIKNNRIIMA